VLREKDEERLYSIADPNWNVVAICDSVGSIQERYTYDAFGKRNVYDMNFVAKNASDFNWNRAFTGQVLDTETGLILCRMRYLNTNLGRFINRDPIEYWADDINIYRYVQNMPIDNLDPLGKQTRRTWREFWREWWWDVAPTPLPGPVGIGVSVIDPAAARGAIGIAGDIGTIRELSRPNSLDIQNDPNIDGRLDTIRRNCPNH
jgi:RHS repeat-associated protein